MVEVLSGDERLFPQIKSEGRPMKKLRNPAQCQNIMKKKQVQKRRKKDEKVDSSVARVTPPTLFNHTALHWACTEVAVGCGVAQGLYLNK